MNRLGKCNWKLAMKRNKYNTEVMMRLICKKVTEHKCTVTHYHASLTPIDRRPISRICGQSGAHIESVDLSGARSRLCGNY